MRSSPGGRTDTASGFTRACRMKSVKRSAYLPIVAF